MQSNVCESECEWRSYETTGRMCTMSTYMSVAEVTVALLHRDRVISADLMEGFELCRCPRQGHRI